MTLEKEALEEKEEKRVRCIMVGLQMDGSGRELLNWALSKVADEGDRVVALHVCRNSDLCNISTQSVIKMLDDFLTVYEGLCSLKKVALVGRVSRGSSIRRVLVREAKVCAATAVVVGVNKNFSLGGSASVARYCAKKLPPTVALIAVHCGKVIFQRESTQPPSELKQNLGSLLHPSVGMDTKAIIPSNKFEPDTGTPRSSNVGSIDEAENGKAWSDSRSISVLVRELPEPSPGWPLLRRAVRANIEALKDGEARKMSVVQWVMKLPNRSLSSSPIHSASTDLTKELEIILQSNLTDCKWLQYEDLRASTNQFCSENLIGKGGSSQVYKGCLPDEKQVAIKLSKLSDETSRDFMLEVDIITTLKHQRIVPLIGVCIEDKKILSVYGYFSKGSLAENLHGRRAKPALTWDKRFKVAIGIAEALSYLHEECLPMVIHRDVKSSNILLTDEFEPQLSDFGLAIRAPMNSSYQTNTDVVGTFGYLAPEYFMYGKVSDKVDVYAYGVVLLELLTGRKPISDENPKGQESLVMWATPVVEKGDFKELLDPNLDGKYDEDQMRRMVSAASLCITRAARLRPQMSQVLRLLRGEGDVESLINSSNNDSPNELNFQDEEAYPASSVGSHLGLALLDVEDDDASVISFEQHHLNSLDEYLRERWSRSSSFD